MCGAGVSFRPVWVAAARVDNPWPATSGVAKSTEGYLASVNMNNKRLLKYIIGTMLDYNMPCSTLDHATTYLSR